MIIKILRLDKNMSHHIAFTLGALTTAGGLYAGLVKGSKPSLAAGALFGGAFLASGWMMKENKANGVELALGTSALLFGAILPRALKTRLPAPVVLSFIGATGSLYYGRKLYQQFYGV